MTHATAIWLIKLGGIASLGWLLFHIFFWRLFEWPTQLQNVSATNRGVMQVLNLCLSFIFLLFAIISLWYADALLEPAGLGRVLLAGMGGFWFLRLLEQPLFFGTSRISQLFSLLFLLTSACYLAPLVLQ